MVKAIAGTGIQGYTLVELLVTISIMVALLLATVPLINDWVYSAQTRDARAKLEQGLSTAKALALRNPAQVSQPDAPAAGLRVVKDASATTLLVCAGDPGAADCKIDGASVYWHSSYPASVSTTLSAATPPALGLNNRGLPLSPPDYRLSRGGPQNDERVTFH